MSKISLHRKMVNVFLRTLQLSKYNRDFTYSVEMENDEVIAEIVLKNNFRICFSDTEIMLQVYEIDILMLYQSGINIWGENDFADRIVFGESIDDLPEVELAELLYRIICYFASAINVYSIKKEPYNSNSVYKTFYYDIYVTDNHMFNSAKVANMNIHYNEEIKSDLRNENKAYKVYSDDLLNYRSLVQGVKMIHLAGAKYETQYFWNRSNQYYSDSYNPKLKMNGIDGDFYLDIHSKYVILYCRNMPFYLFYDERIMQNVINKTHVFHSEGKFENCIEFYSMIGEMRLLLTGAGDISYEKHFDEAGCCIGCDIYVEKEYDESYEAEYGNIRFHINDGYKHKTEKERLEVFFETDKCELKELSDIPRLVLKLLQTTKASRYLCYKLEEKNIVTLYFNGSAGDFYIKANAEQLLLHCRDMAICFTENADILGEEGDSVIRYHSDKGSLKDVFADAFEMIYIFAGAGEVSHNTIESDDKPEYEILLEKEYEDDRVEHIGNLIFCIKRESIAL